MSNGDQLVCHPRGHELCCSLLLFFLPTFGHVHASPAPYPLGAMLSKASRLPLASHCPTASCSEGRGAFCSGIYIRDVMRFMVHCVPVTVRTWGQLRPHAAPHSRHTCCQHTKDTHTLTHTHTHTHTGDNANAMQRIVHYDFTYWVTHKITTI